MAATAKNTSAVIGITTTEFFIWRRRILWTYTGGFIGIAVILMILIKMMVGWNHASIVEMNPDLMFRSYIVAVIGLLFWAFVRHFPDALGIMIGLGTIKGLPDFKLGEFLSGKVGAMIPNLEMKKFGEEIWKTFQWFWKVLDHLMLFFLVMCAVFGTFPIENPAGVIGSLVVLAGLGIWVMLFTKNPWWYQRVTFVIIMVCLGTMLYGTYMHFRPQDTTIEKVETVLERNEDARQDQIAKLLLEGAKKGASTAAERELIKSMSEARKERGIGGLVGIYKDLTYEKKISVLVNNFQDKKISGVRPGTRKFQIPGDRLLVPTRSGVARDLKGGTILMNGSPEGSDFVVEADGVVTVSTIFTDDFKRDDSNIPIEAIAMSVIIK